MATLQGYDECAMDRPEQVDVELQKFLEARHKEADARLNDLRAELGRWQRVHDATSASLESLSISDPRNQPCDPMPSRNY